MTAEGYLLDLGALLLLASVFALLARLFKQPLLIAYILTGAVLAPFLTASQDQTLVKTFATIGTTLLLFLVGLELDVRRVKELGRRALWTAIGQFALTAVGGFALAVLALHLEAAAAITVGLAFAFSSTVIVIHHLSDRHDLHSLHGRLATLTLLLQDVAALVALIFLSGSIMPDSLWFDLTTVVLKAAALTGVIFLISQTALPYLFRFIARSEELLFLMAISWCLLFALLAKELGFSVEIGAFLAGLSLASLPYSAHIVGRVKPIRDFFIIIFFIGLGQNVRLGAVANAPLAFGLLLAATVLAKPLISLVLLSAAGFRKRVALLTAVSQSQLSEFSLILLLASLNQGAISADTYSLIALVTVTSMAISSVLMTHSHQLATALAPAVSWLERPVEQAAVREQPQRGHWLIFGCDDIGQRLLKALKRSRLPAIGIDFNPDTVRRLTETGFDVRYGDMADGELMAEVGLKSARTIVATVRDEHDTTHLLHHLRRLRHRGNTIVTAEHVDEAMGYYAMGADFVLLPSLISGEYAAEIIKAKLLRQPEGDKRLLQQLRREQARAIERTLGQT